MTCSSCGKLIPEGAKFCGLCGATQAAPAPAESAPAPVYQEAPQPVPQEAPAYAAPPAPVYQEQPAYQAQPAYQPQPAYQAQPAYQPQPAYQAPPAAEPAPSKGSLYAPIGTLGYIGYFILFAIPIIGQILCIAFAFGKGGNVNRRNLAKAMFVMLIIGLVLGLSLFITGAVVAKQIQNGTIDQNGIFSWVPGLATGGGSGSGGIQFPFSGGSEGGDPQGFFGGGSGGSGSEGGGVNTPEDPFSGLGQMFSATWPENEFTKQVPKPKFETSIGVVEDYSCSILTGASVDQLKDYVKDLKKAGFDKNADTQDQNVFGMQVYGYTASNNKGYGVEIAYAMGMSTITISRVGASS